MEIEHIKGIKVAGNRLVTHPRAIIIVRSCPSKIPLTHPLCNPRKEQRGGLEREWKTVPGAS